MIEALQRLAGFDALDPATIAMIVARSTVRRFEPGQLILAVGDVAETLLACIDGAATRAAGTNAPPVFDAPGLLFGLPVREEYRAGPAGLTALQIAKPHAFTIAREFPEFIVSLIAAQEAGR